MTATKQRAAAQDVLARDALAARTRGIAATPASARVGWDDYYRLHFVECQCWSLGRLYHQDADVAKAIRNDHNRKSHSGEV